MIDALLKGKSVAAVRGGGLIYFLLSLPHIPLEGWGCRMVTCGELILAHVSKAGRVKACL